MEQLPLPFIERTQALLQHEFDAFLRALSLDPPVSVRVNDKTAYVPSSEQVPWCKAGYYLPERRLFTADPLFHAGGYYVQEASSMFLNQALHQYVDPRATVLDLCAAPGGKSTLISQYLRGGLLVSNEIVKSRAHILSENTIKWGNAHVLVSHNAPADFGDLHAFFDTIAVDAPCSGEGMFRKDAGAIREWSETNVAMCAARQKEILKQVWNALKTDGILIYSTCTYNREENEDIVRWVEKELGAQFQPVETSCYPGIVTSDKGHRFYPHRTQGEGFFISVLRKTAGTPPQGKVRGSKPIHSPAAMAATLRKQLKDPDQWDVIMRHNTLSAIPNAHADSIHRLHNRLRLLHTGIVLAEQKGKDLVPDISLALSKALNIHETAVYDIDWPTAIRYLSKETIVLPNAPRGYVLLRHRSVPIGWVKNLGTRANNLYPNEWRIRMRIEVDRIDDTFIASQQQ